MRYYLKNVREGTCWWLGSDSDLDQVAKNILFITNGQLRWGLQNKDAVLDGYNQTGKDEYFYETKRSYYSPFPNEPWIRLPRCEYAWSLRPWLVVDEDGRHIAKEVVAGWLEAYKPKYHSHWIGHSGSKQHWRRCRWPSLLNSDLRNHSDTGSTEEVLELVGAHAAHKMNRRAAQTKAKTSWYNLEEWSHQPRKSWKGQKCKRQWQKHKKCGQLPAKPIPYADPDTGDILAGIPCEEG